MSNFGFAQMRLVMPYDVAFREARSAVKSGYILEQAEIHDSVADAVRDCSLVVGTTALGNRDVHVPIYPLEAAASEIKQHAQASPVALLFGSEKFGLSNDDLSYCHMLIRIPTRQAHGSMNLGQAVAICLYELRRGVEEVRPFTAPPRATADDIERITALLLEMLGRSGYINEVTAQSTEWKIRRLIRRTDWSASDAAVWLGMLRQIRWKLQQQAADQSGKTVE